MFDLASSEAGHQEESIKSLSNGSEKLTQAVYGASSSNWQFNPSILANKMNALDEIDCQNLSDITGWAYVEENMPIATSHIIRKCFNENLSLYSFILREIDDSPNLNLKVTFIGLVDPSDKKPLSKEEIRKDADKIQSTSLQEYLSRLTHSLTKDIQVQLVLKGLEKRTQQIKDAAIPDTQKLSLIQRYRTADERQFSKTLEELLKLQKRRKASS